MLGSEIALVSDVYSVPPFLKHLIICPLKGIAVQRIGWIIAVIIVLVWWGTEVQIPNASSNDQSVVQTCWRRTVDGWENANRWHADPIPPKTFFHPVYFGLIQCSLAMWIGVFCYVAKLEKKGLGIG